jgi:TetR/AcrR family transcriptional regulator, repressor of fatR-cypB operon
MAKPSQRRRTASAAERREAILSAALECFVERGFHGTAVPQVAKAAGIATGTIYHYFPSKDVLVNALYRKWKGAIATRVLMAFPQGASPREQFEVMWREMVDFAMANPRAFAFLELHNHRSYLDDESLAMENGLKDFGATMVMQAQAEGLVKQGSTTLLMELVFGSFIGMMQAHWEGRIELTQEQRSFAQEACWDTIAARPPA